MKLSSLWFTSLSTNNCTFSKSATSNVLNITPRIEGQGCQISRGKIRYWLTRIRRQEWWLLLSSIIVVVEFMESSGTLIITYHVLFQFMRVFGANEKHLFFVIHVYSCRWSHCNNEFYELNLLAWRKIHESDLSAETKKKKPRFRMAPFSKHEKLGTQWLAQHAERRPGNKMSPERETKQPEYV